ncbi:molecular chaperone [Enterobacteriaceae bacterium 89]|nr:molecular chaperone [Enterobacteriaceae bacterium 89]
MRKKWRSKGIIKTVLILVVVNIYLSASSSFASGIQIGRTRIIYDASKKEVSLPLTNKDSNLPWLVQAWTDTGANQARGPFIITPPLFRLDPQKEQSLRITWSGVPLPEDRESLFYMNVRTIPAMDKDADQQNVLRLIYKTRLKLFWRPTGLKGTPVENCQHLRFTLSGNVLTVHNDGDYYSVFDTLSVGTQAVKGIDFVAPHNSLQHPLTGSNRNSAVKWRCISDYGNATQPFSGLLGQS